MTASNDVREYVLRMLEHHEPHCGHPKCKLKAFAPAIGNVGDTGGHIMFWCTDHGHWIGDETEVCWKQKMWEGIPHVRQMQEPDARIAELEAENAHFKTRCEYLQAECEKLVVMAKELRKANHTLRGLVDVVLDTDEFNGHDVSKADRELRLPKAWITEARKVVGDE